jgi:hypothetical protein
MIFSGEAANEWQFTAFSVQKIWRASGPWQDAKIPAHSRAARCKWNATCALGDRSNRRRFPGDDPHIFHISTLTLWTFYFLHTSVIWFRTWEGDKPWQTPNSGFGRFHRFHPLKIRDLEGNQRFCQSFAHQKLDLSIKAWDSHRTYPLVMKQSLLENPHHVGYDFPI